MKLFPCTLIVTAFCASLVDELRMLSFPKQAAGGIGQPELKPPTLHRVVDDPIPVPPAEPEDEIPDMECKDSIAWLEAQKILVELFNDDAAFGAMEKAELETGLHHIMEKVSKHIRLDECGVGKLMVQLLAIIAADIDGKVIIESFGSESITSPIMTVALDIPWVVSRKWPVMGLFAQMASRLVSSFPNEAETDGLTTQEIISVAMSFSQGVIDEDWSGIAETSQTFIENAETLIPIAPLGYITSLFAHAAVITKHPEAIENPKHNPAELIMLAQETLRHLVREPGQLLAVLGTRWPLWGMAHLAMNGIAAV